MAVTDARVAAPCLGEATRSKLKSLPVGIVPAKPSPELRLRWSPASLASRSLPALERQALPGQAGLCGPSTAPATVRAPEWMKPPTCWLHQRRHALRKQRHAKRRARPRSKDRGPSFHGEPHPYGAVACHPVASTHPGRSIPDGEPCSPTGAAFPFASRRRTAMCASQATRAPRPVGVLLGGSGRVRAQVPPAPRLAALLRPAAA
jgi:hypothetical protein